MNTNPPPLIAITCGNSSESPHGRKLYTTAVENAGGDAVFLSPDTDVNALATRYDGFIIPGGRDLPPSFYGENQLCRVFFEEPARIDFEFSLLREIMIRNIPVLGICYGMQLINVFFQGSLYQDLPLQSPASLEHTGGGHGVIILDNPFMEAGEYEVNSSHHQAVKRVGKGLVSFARAHDGVIEAFYGLAFHFLVGIQWHPERMSNYLSKRLFERFVGACRVQG